MATETTQAKILWHINPVATQPLMEAIDSEHAQRKTVSSRENVVHPGEVIAEVIESSDPRFFSNDRNIVPMELDYRQTIGSGVSYEADKRRLMATAYGFARLDGRRTLEVVPLVDIAKDGMLCELYVYPDRQGNWPSVDTVKLVISDFNIMFPISTGDISARLAEYSDGVRKAGEATVLARGSHPKNGHVGYYELRKSTELSVGEARDDGRIDYHERTSFIYVRKGELIAEFIPEVPAEEGVDIYGNTIAAKMLGTSKYLIGENIVEDEANPNHFVAAIDGVLVEAKRKLTVEDRLIVNKDINYETGNIRFDGSVLVNGNVLQGFEVHAEKDCAIKGNIDVGSVKANGDVIVTNGILGAGTEEGLDRQVEAKGNVQAMFVQNAIIYADGDVIVEGSVVASNIYSRKNVIVKGSIVGGSVLGRLSVEALKIGTDAGTRTEVITGRDPAIDAKIEVRNAELEVITEELKEHMQEMSMMFGEDFFSKARDIMPRLPSIKKEKAVKALQRIKDLSQKSSELKADIEDLRGQLTFEKPPMIKAVEQVFPDVTIRLKKYKLENNSPLGGVTFREDPVRREIMQVFGTG